MSQAEVFIVGNRWTLTVSKTGASRHIISDILTLSGKQPNQTGAIGKSCSTSRFTTVISTYLVTDAVAPCTLRLIVFLSGKSFK
jgi:hypothetical protein